jgi:hypothetical protein
MSKRDVTETEGKYCKDRGVELCLQSGGQSREYAQVSVAEIAGKAALHFTILRITQVDPLSRLWYLFKVIDTYSCQVGPSSGQFIVGSVYHSSSMSRVSLLGSIYLFIHLIISSFVALCLVASVIPPCNQK